MSDTRLPPLDPEKGEWDEQALSRRRLLETGFWLIAGVGTLGVLGAGTGFLVGNSLEPKEQHWVTLGEVEKLPAGPVHRVAYSFRARDAWRDTDQRGVIFTYTDDGETYTALDATCTHLGCIVRWKEAENYFACPCHAGFYTREGDVISGPPPRPLRRLETKIEQGVLKALI